MRQWGDGRRIVVSSDWHIDAVTAGLPRFDDLRAAVDEVVGAAVELRADMFWFLGDLCDPDTMRAHGCAELAAEVAARLAAHNIASRWLVGNHDVIEDGHRTSTLSALLGVERGSGGMPWRVLDRPGVERVYLGTREMFARNEGAVDIVALPFTPRSHPYDPDAFIRELVLVDERRPVFVLGHLNIAGIEPGSETSDMPRGRDVFFPLEACRQRFGDRAVLLNGHYHTRQVFKGIHIPGALERLTFGEEHNEPGYLVIEVPDAAA